MVMSDNEPELQPDQARQIEAARDWVKGHFSESPDQRYEPLEGKLRVLEAILANDWVDRSETWKLQALGVVFGDALAQKLMLEWVTVEDDDGCDPALHRPGTSIYSFPLTMISKRVEAGEWIDVQALFDATCSRLGEMAFSGRYG